MHHGVDATHCRVEGLGIEDRPLHELAIDAIEIGPVARRQIVDTDDLSLVGPLLGDV